MALEILPLRDQVVVRRVPRDTVTKGGLVIPDEAQVPPTEGVVVAVGPGRWTDLAIRIEPGVKAGDVVIFPDDAGILVREDDEELLILREHEILAKKVQPKPAQAVALRVA